ncbi:MAG: transposase [Coriobacteriia bacterium]
MADKATRYPDEFKREAVRLYRSGQHGGMEKTAKALGVGHTAIRRWVRQADIDQGDAEGLTTEEKAEFLRLKRENAVLREEREILKKAAAFFVRETDRTR